MAPPWLSAADSYLVQNFRCLLVVGTVVVCRYFEKQLLRPFLTQSDSASRKRPFFDWTVFLLGSSGPPPFCQPSRLYSFCALPRSCWCEGVLLHCCMAIQNRLAALCFATFVALQSAESRQSYSRRTRCWQNGIDTGRCCGRVIHAAGERS